MCQWFENRYNHFFAAYLIHFFICFFNNWEPIGNCEEIKLRKRINFEINKICLEKERERQFYRQIFEDNLKKYRNIYNILRQKKTCETKILGEKN